MFWLTHRRIAWTGRGSDARVAKAIIAIVVAMAAFWSAAAAQARDLVAFAEPTLAPALEALGNAWRARGGVEVHVFSSPTALALAQADRRIRCDLVVGLAGPAFEKAAKDETIDSDTTAPFASNTLVLIERGDPERGEMRTATLPPCLPANGLRSQTPIATLPAVTGSRRCVPQG